jgi:hypothetical protein
MDHKPRDPVWSSRENEAHVKVTHRARFRICEGGGTPGIARGIVHDEVVLAERLEPYKVARESNDNSMAGIEFLPNLVDDVLLVRTQGYLRINAVVGNRGFVRWSKAFCVSGILDVLGLCAHRSRRAICVIGRRDASASDSRNGRRRSELQEIALVAAACRRPVLRSSP